MTEPAPEPTPERDPSPAAADDASALAAYEFHATCSASQPVKCERRALWFAALVHTAHPPTHGPTRCTADLLACDVHRDHFTAAVAAGHPSWCPTHGHEVVVEWTRL